VRKEDILRYGFELPYAVANDGKDVVTLYRGVGCDKCKKTGYKGRTGVHELMVVTDELRDMIMKEAAAHDLRHKAIEVGMKPLQSDALSKVLLGITTLDEVVRVIYA
jgi:type II secretory ATPase GspE/PulE/Tfp pilus assembly ATPase PilB-like protein